MSHTLIRYSIESNEIEFRAFWFSGQTLHQIHQTIDKWNDEDKYYTKWKYIPKSCEKKIFPSFAPLRYADITTSNPYHHTLLTLFK